MTDQFNLESVTYRLLQIHAAIRVELDRITAFGPNEESFQRLDGLLVRQEIGLILVNEATKNGFSREPQT